MNFEDVVGQEQLILYLNNSIKRGTVGHAYSFDGPSGVGKTTAALAFAKSILCKSLEEKPCNTCSACIKVNHLNHPDLHIIEPEGNSIKNKQIEDFQHELQLKPYESNKKVFIIKKANEMTVSAQNRLLKTLEEPPEYVLIILLSSNVNGFLPTIKSRCQILKFKRVGEKKIEELLINRYNTPKEDAKIFAAFSRGIIGNALKLMESKEFVQDRDEIIKIIERLSEKDRFTVFQATEFFSANKDKIYEHLDVMLFWFRDMLILKETNCEQHLINPDKKIALQRQLNHIAYEKISNIIDIIEKTKKDIKANVNFQLAIEMMLLRIQEV